MANFLFSLLCLPPPVNEVQAFGPVIDCWWWRWQRKWKKKRLTPVPPFTLFTFLLVPDWFLNHHEVTADGWSGTKESEVKGGRLPGLFYFFIWWPCHEMTARVHHGVEGHQWWRRKRQKGSRTVLLKGDSEGTDFIRHVVVTFHSFSSFSFSWPPQMYKELVASIGKDWERERTVER